MHLKVYRLRNGSHFVLGEMSYIYICASWESTSPASLKPHSPGSIVRMTYVCNSIQSSTSCPNSAISWQLPAYQIDTVNQPPYNTVVLLYNTICLNYYSLTALFITRDSEVIMFSPCVCVCLFVCLFVCLCVCVWLSMFVTMFVRTI